MDTHRHGDTQTQVNTWTWGGQVSGTHGHADTGTLRDAETQGHTQGLRTQGHVSPSPWQDDFPGPPSLQGLAPEKLR